MPAESEPGALSDGALLALAARGDREAFGAFVRRHEAALLRFATSLSARDGDAEDALQEGFLTAWRKAGTFRAEGSARSWLFTIARRKLRRADRRAEPSRDAESLEELGEAAGWGRVTREPRLGVDSALDRLILSQAFGRLRAADRAVLVLIDLEGLGAAEAAAVLGIAERATKSRLHRARLRLAAALRSGGRDDGR